MMRWYTILRLIYELISMYRCIFIDNTQSRLLVHEAHLRSDKTGENLAIKKIKKTLFNRKRLVAIMLQAFFY